MNLENIRQQAQNENTTLGILTKLANRKDRITRQYVAANPNTPVEILEKLSEEFPDEITDNPVFYLLMLENPERKFIIMSLARSSTTSEETLIKLAHHENKNVRQAIAENCNATANVLGLLVNDESIDVKVAISRNENLPLNILSFLAKDRDVRVRRAVAENRRTPSDSLASLAINKDNDVRLAVARNRNTPLNILAKSMKDKDNSIRLAVIYNPQSLFLKKAIKKMTKDKNRSIAKAAREILNMETPFNHNIIR